LRFIHNANDHPADWTFIITDGSARGKAIRRNDHTLVHGRAVRVNSNLRHAFHAAGMVDRLANDKPPTLEAGVLAGSREIAFNASEQHGQKAE
jgi:hypothetical protein